MYHLHRLIGGVAAAVSLVGAAAAQPPSSRVPSPTTNAVASLTQAGRPASPAAIDDAVPSEGAQPLSSATTLAPPVAVTYAGTSPALSVTADGTGKGIQATITNAKSSASALYGSTNGRGAAVSGYNAGTAAPAARFGINNTQSTQPVVLANTQGSGSALVGISSMGSGVYGYTGGNSVSDGVAGVWGQGSGSIGVMGNDSGGGAGVYGVAAGAGGVGVLATATDGTGLFGQDLGAGYGVYGSSQHGIAGYFDGTVTVTRTLYVNGVSVTSDRNLKTGFQPVDGRALLARLQRVPITSWVFTDDPERRHLGPMAQDFHDAFHLNGDDDRHIGEVDAVGVSLAGIQELEREMRVKDAQIARLEAVVAAQAETLAKLTATMSTRLTRLEQGGPTGPRHTTGGVPPAAPVTTRD